MTKLTDNEFWVTNVSDRDVSLSDLGLSISARRTVNLLDRRHYSFDRPTLIASKTNGSLYLKRDKIRVRKVPPVFERRQMLEIDYNAHVPTRRKSAVVIVDVHYDELDLSDDKFAEQAADLVDQPRPLK